MKTIYHYLKRSIKALENSNASFLSYFFSFLFIVLLRNFLEMFSDDLSFDLFIHLHYLFFYIAITLSLILITYLLTQENLLRIFKTIIPLVFLILLAPLFDLILSKGKGFNMEYFLPGVHENILIRFFSFFGNFHDIGITPGLRMEVFIMLSCFFFYFSIKTGKLLKSILGVFIAYIIFFLYTVTPFLIIPYCSYFKCFSQINQIFIAFYASISLVLSILLLHIQFPLIVKIILKDFRLLRQTHYILMFTFGLVLGYQAILSNNSLQKSFALVTPFPIFITIFSIIFACLFSAITNNIVDYQIDQISNPERPLIKEAIPIKLYNQIGWSFLFISLLLATLSGFTTFFIITLFIGNYYLYSIPPLRLKRVFFFSKLVISLNSLILMLLGYLYFIENINTFPKSLIWIVLIGFTGSIQFIDLKDYAGDKAVGIKTLPVVLGLKKSKLIIGLFFFLNYLAFFFLFQKLFLLPIFLTGGFLQFYLINRSNYIEKMVFVNYLIGLIFVIFLSFFLQIK